MKGVSVMQDWVIIGGGIQGITLASYLLAKKCVPIEQLTIIDPHEEPLAMWKHCTKKVGMSYLRSPSIHHLQPEPFGLEAFAKKKNLHKQQAFVPPYDRPKLSLFNEHCEHLIKDHQIKQSWVQGRVNGLKKNTDFWMIQLESGEVITSRHVVLAIGVGEQPIWPDFAYSLKEEGAKIEHIFDQTKCITSEEDQVLVAGGGISGVQTALKLSSELKNPVTLLTRHPFRVKQFDSHPGWLGPKYMRHFLKKKSYDQRRSLIKQARNRGSLPAELRTMLRRAESEGLVQSIVNEIAETYYDGRIHLTFQDGTSWYGDKVILATGFHPNPPGMDWLTQTIEEEHLTCHTCGYPIVDDHTLEWSENLFVLGALAELSLGPVARNISGARRGAERIIAAHSG